MKKKRKKIDAVVEVGRKASSDSLSLKSRESERQENSGDRLAF
jgi:hypothetical protein